MEYGTYWDFWPFVNVIVTSMLISELLAQVLSTKDLYHFCFVFLRYCVAFNVCC